LTIVPGQQFACTIHQQDLSAKINQQPDIPCNDVSISMANDEVQVTCRMGIKLNAIGVVDVDDCRMSIRIVRGTIGFVQAVQSLLDANAQLVPYDVICVEQATVGDGTIAISGYGR
jgi:hypothetical protein